MLLTPSLVLRIAIAFAFLYPPIAAYFSPDNWIWFVPDFVELVMPKLFFMQLFSVLQILIAFGILFLKNPTLPAVAASIILAAIIVLTWSAFDATFRDVSIFLAAIALIMLYHRNAILLDRD